MRLFPRKRTAGPAESAVESAPEPARPPAPTRFAPEIVLTPTPRVGVVIGTHAAVAYVALQMEARRRFWPDVPLLVHDDASPAGAALADLCRRHGAEFVSPPRRLGAHRGDMDAYVAGLDWGRRARLDVVVKLSRRLVLHRPWVAGLQELAYNTQYATYGNACIYYDFPLRTECIGLHVESWHVAGAVAELRRTVEGGLPVADFLEPWYHGLCLRVHADRAPAILRKREELFPRDPRWGGYGVWHMLGLGRHAKVPGVLWHDVHTPEDYWRLAQSWGLTEWTLADFQRLDTGRNPDTNHDETARGADLGGAAPSPEDARPPGP